MSSISEHLAAIRAALPSGVTLVAVSKYYDAGAVRQAYDAGQRLFGESRALDATAKYEALPQDIEWHFIGHLQTNKVKYIAPYISLIHSIDSLKLLAETERQAAKCGRLIDVLLQIHIAREETKFGFTFDECRQMLEEDTWRRFSHVNIRGVMTVASLTDQTERIRKEFRAVRQFFDEIKGRYFAYSSAFNIYSAGMSHDYLTAVEEGSNCVRIGTSIFAQ